MKVILFIFFILIASLLWELTGLEEAFLKYERDVNSRLSAVETKQKNVKKYEEQLLEFVFDTSKVAKLPVDVEFDDVARSMFWAIHGDDGVSVKVKGLEYEVDEYVVIIGGVS